MHIHASSHDHADHPSSTARVFLIGLGLTVGFAGVELVAGWLAGSLALMGDAGHMVTDALALGLGAVAARLGGVPPSRRHSYGLQRAEIMGALANAVFMFAVVAWIGYEAIQRLLSPTPVQGAVVLVVAAIGLMVNLAVLRVLHGGEQNLNTQGATLHVLGDMLGSVAALVSGIVITLTGWVLIDPLLSLLICALIIASTWRVLRDAVHVMMEGVPRHIDLREVGERLAGVSGVIEVHDLHVWTIASGSHALSAHVRLRTLDGWPELLRHMERVLREEFGIEHTTLQPEPPYEVAFVSPAEIDSPASRERKAH